MQDAALDEQQEAQEAALVKEQDFVCACAYPYIHAYIAHMGRTLHATHGFSSHAKTCSKEAAKLELPRMPVQD